MLDISNSWFFRIQSGRNCNPDRNVYVIQKKLQRLIPKQALWTQKYLSHCAVTQKQRFISILAEEATKETQLGITFDSNQVERKHQRLQQEPKKKKGLAYPPSCLNSQNVEDSIFFDNKIALHTRQIFNQINVLFILRISSKMTKLREQNVGINFVPSDRRLDLKTQKMSNFQIADWVDLYRIFFLVVKFQSGRLQISSIIILLFQEMGSGCLAPKPLQGDLAIQLIDEMHQSAPGGSRQQKYLQESNNYKAQKQKLFKKGPLRKLVDYLSSHRHKLVDSLTHNVKISIQKGTRASWTAGLIILERIVMMGGNITTNEPSEKLENILRNKGQNSSFHQSQKTKAQLRTLKTQSQKQNISGYYAIQQSATETIVSQIISTRFESALLDTISACLEDQQLYPQCLRILCDYIKLKPRHMSNEDKVMILLNTLMQNIKIDFESIITLQTYYRLLTKLKDKVVLSIASNMKTMIKMWIQFKQLIQCSKSIDIINKYDNKISAIELIIARFLTSSLNGMQYKSMISLLMEVQDQYSFGLSLQFESLYVYILNNSQLGQHLMKALFLEFIRYGVMGNFSSTIFKEIIQSSQQLLSCHSHTAYKNLKKKETRENFYQLIKRWLVTKKYILLEDIIKYHSSLLVYCFLQSFTSDYKTICIDIIKQITPEQKIILIQTIFDIYQRAQTSHKVRQLLLQFNKILSEELKQITLMANKSRFNIDVSVLNTVESIQLFTSLMILYHKFDKQTCFLYIQQICELLGSILTFLSEQRQGKKEEFISNLLNFVTGIISIEGIVIAFYQKVLKTAQYKSLKEVECSELKAIVSQMEMIFDRNQIKNYKESQTSFDQRNDSTDSEPEFQKIDGFQKCKNYFRDLAVTETKSKFYSPDNNFQKVNSVLKDQNELKEEESIRDIMDMINN